MSGCLNVLMAHGGSTVLTEDYTSSDTMTWVTHARTGHAMMFDSTGKLTFAPNNILLNGNNFSGSYDKLSGATVDATGVSDPFSGSNASTITLPNGGAIARYETVESGNYAAGIWLKGSGNVEVTLMTSGYSGVTTTNVTLTGTWTFYDAVGAISGTLAGLFVRNGSGSSVTFDAYLGVCSRITYESHVRSGDKVLITGTAYYGPRMDYNPATLAKRGLLREMSRTNVVLYNRDLTNAAWTKTNVTAAKDQTGIDGVTNSASKITATAGNGTCLQAITLASSARYQSCWVKRVTGSGTIEMTMDNGSTWTAITVTGSWTRVAIPTQTLANPTVGFRIVTDTDAIAIDMVQNEDGTSWTSEIPTTSASVTRAADDLTAALYTADSVTEYYRLVSDLSETSRTVNPFSGVTDETDSIWVKKFTKP